VELGTLIFTTAIGAIGLMLLFGRVGQLSLGHPFFLAIGAYSYIIVASPMGPAHWALGWPSVIGIPAAAVLAGLGGLIVSPIASRVRGLSLGLATLALTFIGEWILTTFHSIGGGYTGRMVPPLQIGPFSTAGSHVVVAGVSVGSAEFLWYIALVLLLAVSVFTANLFKGRVGRAFTAIRDGEVHATTLGVEVTRYRAIAFVISSAYAGLAGSLYVIIIQYVVPNYWGLELALSYLAMIVIGGMRSINGAILGAALVTALPALLQHYGHAIPILNSSTSLSVLSHVIYGVIVVVILLFEPMGIVRILERIMANISPALRKTSVRANARGRPKRF
jgi:branched-chain amino acid transport system permease protein